MANKILVARGTKARIEEIKSTLTVNELVYSTDTGELGVKRADGNIEYFMNAAAIDASKQDKLVAGANITIVGNTISASGGSGSGINYILDYTTTEDVSEIELTNLDITDGKRIYFNWWLKNSNTGGGAYIKVNNSSSAYRTVKNTSSTSGSGAVTQSAGNYGFLIGAQYMGNCFIEGVFYVDADKKAFMSWKESYYYNNRIYQADGAGYGEFNLTDDKITSIQFRKVTVTNSPAILAGSVLKVWEM